VISYAQNLEDVVLNRIFQGKRRGFYIDVGAHDPTDLSVTRYFYDHLEWQGINVEPIPASFDKFLAERPRDINLNLALGARHDFLTLYEVQGRPDLSTFSEDVSAASSRLVNAPLSTHTVEVRTLEEICRTYCSERFIDFIKIDVEGYEKEVIAGGNWLKYRPTAVVVESTVPTRAVIKDWDQPDKYASWHEWEHLLVDAGYVFAYYDGLNRLYVRREDAHLARRYHIPITPLQDDFSLYKDTRRLEEELGQARATIQQLEDELSQLENDLSRVRKDLEGSREAREVLHGTLAQRDAEIASERARASRLEAAVGENIRTIEALRSVLVETQRSGSLLVRYMRRLRGRPWKAVQRSSIQPAAKDPALPSPVPFGGLSALEPQQTSLGQLPSSSIGPEQSNPGFTFPKVSDAHPPRPAMFAPQASDNGAFGTEALESMFGSLRDVLVSRRVELVRGVDSPRVLASLPARQAWLGLLASPNRLPEWATRTTAYRTLSQPYDLSHVNAAAQQACQGIVVFSADHASLLNRSNVPIVAASHPLPPVSVHWSAEGFAANPQRAIVQYGWWLMRTQALHLLPKSPYRKLWVRASSPALDEVVAAEREADRASRPFIELSRSAIDELELQAVPNVRNLLCSNIAFAHFLDASAPAWLMSCIAHHTPMLVNPLPAVREYLGADYPLYYYFYEDAVEKALDEGRVLAAHEHLRQVAARLAAESTQVVHRVTPCLEAAA
jgi:FkbM family methyltransferase